MIITVPSALISGEIEVRSMAKILVGTVSMPGFFQNRVAVMLSNEMATANRKPRQTSAMSYTSLGISLN